MKPTLITRIREWRYWYAARPARKLGMAFIWALPKAVAYWSFVRVATHDYDGNPGERTVLDAMKGWEKK